MNTINDRRYSSVAITLHWVIAIVIIGLIGIAKYMTSLDEADPLRYSLTQWHKSFGITVLLLAVVRILWRLWHKPPSLPEHMNRLERLAAHGTHLLLYVLMLLLPLTGWLLVSASPLNLQTILFGAVPWPHLPITGTAGEKELLTQRFFGLHHNLGNVVLLLVVLHILAALKHQFLNKDGLLQRMSPITATGNLDKGVIWSFMVLLLLAGGLYANSLVKPQQPVISAGNGTVGITLIMMGAETTGTFGEANFDLGTDSDSVTYLNATVAANTLATGDSQIDLSLADEDWLDTTRYPDARFQSSTVSLDDTIIDAEGELTIKGISRPVSIQLTIDNSASPPLASGVFVINRLDFDIGKVNQPDDSSVGYNIEIAVQFELMQ